MVGPEGRAIGIDMTPAMIDRARANAKTGGYTNVEFYLSTIDQIPLPDASVDCVISNCVLNLAPDKPAVFREIARVLKPGGRVAVSDIALKRELPESIAKSVAAYVGCIAGAILIDDYKAGLLAAGFEHVEVVDSGKDLNAYAKVENQSGCCSSKMEASSPFQVIEESCCTPLPDTSAPLHEELKTLLSRYDINAAAASVKVYALKPRNKTDGDNASVTVRERKNSDRPSIDNLLHSAQLPTNGLEQTRGWVAEIGGQLIGHIALEESGDAVLLRSLVVAQNFQGKGIARQLLDRAEQEIGERVALLRTKSVGAWVERRGYHPASAGQIPQSLLGTSEFEGSLCSGYPVFIKGAATPSTSRNLEQTASCCNSKTAGSCCESVNASVKE
jgi:SAM-dependent methyltransferase/N-acetylglutamate synthase-like GNAT family acetyltransferase